MAGSLEVKVVKPSMVLCVPAHSAKPSDSQGDSPKMSVQARHWPTVLTGRDALILQSPAKAKAALPLPSKGAIRAQIPRSCSYLTDLESHPNQHLREPFKG